MRLPVPGPRDALALLERVGGLLSSTEKLLTDAAGVVTRIHALVDRVEETRQEASVVIGRVEETRQRASTLMARLEPPLNELLPVLERLAETTEADEVDAMVALIDQLPALATRVEEDVLPVLDSLTTVAPDLRHLLETSQELNEMLGKIPGISSPNRSG